MYSRHVRSNVFKFVLETGTNTHLFCTSDWQHRTGRWPTALNLPMEASCAEPVTGAANSMDAVVRWSSAGGRVIASKQKQLFVAPDGVHLVCPLFACSAVHLLEFGAHYIPRNATPSHL